MKWMLLIIQFAGIFVLARLAELDGWERTLAFVAAGSLVSLSSHAEGKRAARREMQEPTP